MTDITQNLVKDGPVKFEPANRRIRGMLGGQWIVDTLDAQYVWEHKYYPVIYVPLRALDAGAGTVSVPQTTPDDGFRQGHISSNDKKAAVTVFDKGPLAGLDEKLLGPHPKDPYKRIECLSSSRSVRIEVDGTVVAESSHNVFLHETGLRTRYYLPPTAVTDWQQLTPSETTSFCPYKGQASYYHLRVNGREIRDAVWYYPYPTTESAAIQGRLSFYNEKLDVFVDGVKE
ncbi:hypothetical protein SPI_05494 [Niveomyces insectorum RCEF 264]|uniref:DUF427 domain-containing protein n=1 Tax=Niveomyces insectorum RCEF 264 TaxID=1081102 RepID=A0A167T9W4_9HYPO|nr:hypothetical protein SPI_05494 [Niveomyces insectorum RCEF 264]